MSYYVAWLNGHSVGIGTRAAVERKAAEVFASEPWQRWEMNNPTTLRVTYGERQRVVYERVLSIDPPGYAARVAALEAEGLTTSDAQGVADVELRQ